MRIPTTTALFAALPPPGRQRLESLARDVSFRAGTRIFEEGERADRFWVVRSGAVSLDLRVPGRHPAPEVETLRTGDLLGWSWLFPPYSWHLGAQAQSLVRAQEFDATVVRALAEADPVFGRALAMRVAEIVGHRLQSARARLLDM
ncbi:Cyclic nucleotide-binding domain-containing protein [Actinacidiphila alni]|uniref:Cyclic nucleotide-binding domain-containing protein n=1 Tax=Actinacidiphila alni TaxID=380248 RepID=A0A1I2HP02_9ACTN|nr:cyclic nucleotide-binding domain-containing protein [Actinacidiphila alni]SFF31874.1 Cyclic nucleotide-binding domain-containing protein [Actinacidiphila alni]